MKCPRCSAMMLIEALRERDTNHLSETISLSRCPSCGYYTDPLMEANRRAPAPKGTKDRFAGGASPLLTKRELNSRARQTLLNAKSNARRSGNALYGLFDDV
jgi:hypothetical protein